MRYTLNQTLRERKHAAAMLGPYGTSPEAMRASAEHEARLDHAAGFHDVSGGDGAMIDACPDCRRRMAGAVT